LTQKGINTIVISAINQESINKAIDILNQLEKSILKN
jgi:hypothetical protein